MSEIEILFVTIRAEVRLEVARTLDGEQHIFPPHRVYDEVDLTVRVTPGDGERVILAAQYGRLKLIIDGEEVSDE